MFQKILLFVLVMLTSFYLQTPTQEVPSDKLEDVQGMKLRANFKAFYLPLYGYRTPKGENSFQEKQISSDIENGSGYGVYLGMDIADKFDSETFSLGFGLILQETKHDSDLDLYEVTIDYYLFEMSFYHTFYRSNKLEIAQQYGFGGGGLSLDYDENRKDFIIGMGTFRYLLNFEFNKHFDFDIGAGLFFCGLPGDTQAYGGFFVIQFGYRF